MCESASGHLDELEIRAHLGLMMMALEPGNTRVGTLRGYAEAAAFVGLSTLVGLLVAPTWGNSAIDLLYLPAVLLAAIWCGFGPSLFAAIASALAYNFFFTAPHFTFRISNPNDVATVLVLFGVATVTSRLAASIRRQAEQAKARAARSSTIAGLARRLLACTGDKEIAEATAGQLAQVFQCNVVLLSGGAEPRLLSASPAPLQLAPNDIAISAAVMASGMPAGRGVERVATTEWQFHPVRSESSTIAVVGLARDDGAAPVPAEMMPLVDNLLDQVALAIERGRLEASAQDFQRIREHDRTRSALLSSIGQDLGPRLKAITTATGDLRRAGAADKVALSAIASDTAWIERYISNLLEVGPEDDSRPLDVGEIRIDLFRRSVSRAGEAIHLTPKEYAVLSELAKHPGRVLTHAHLLRTAWGPAHESQVDYLRVAIRALRQKLEANPSKPKIIINEPAIGYRLQAQ